MTCDQTHLILSAYYKCSAHSVHVLMSNKEHAWARTKRFLNDYHGITFQSNILTKVLYSLCLLVRAPSDITKVRKR